MLFNIYLHMLIIIVVSGISAIIGIILFVMSGYEFGYTKNPALSRLLAGAVINLSFVTSFVTGVLSIWELRLYIINQEFWGYVFRSSLQKEQTIILICSIIKIIVDTALYKKLKSISS